MSQYNIIEPVGVEGPMYELRLQYAGLGGVDGGVYGSTYAQFNETMVRTVSSIITEVLKRNGYNVIVPDDKIIHVMTEVYKNQYPAVGDMYTMFIMDGVGGRQRNDINMILEKTIEIITSQIINEFDMARQNQSFSVWNQVILGEGNPLGIRAFPPIKLNKKTYDRNLIHMKY